MCEKSRRAPRPFRLQSILSRPLALVTFPAPAWPQRTRGSERRIGLPERNSCGAILTDLKPSAVVGEVALFGGKERSANATALTPCHLDTPTYAAAST